AGGAGRRGLRWRWRLLHEIGPVLVAAFANSPLRGGRPTGWRSSRQQVWAHVDPGRTRPPRFNEDPRRVWAAYALDAQVMCVRDDGSADWSAPPGLTLRDWLRGATADGAEPGAAEPDGGRPDNGRPDVAEPDGAEPDSGAPAGGAPEGATPRSGLRLRAPTTEALAYH